MTSIDELAPCPFCGDVPFVETHAAGEGWSGNERRIVCRSKECFGPATAWYGDDEARIAAWNRRSAIASRQAVVSDEALFHALALAYGAGWDDRDCNAPRNTGRRHLERYAEIAAQADYTKRINSALAVPVRDEPKPTEPDWWYDPDDPEITGDFYVVTDDKPAGQPFQVCGASTVKVVWWAHLIAADDADSDDEWECEADTKADCLRLIAAELDRRRALSQTKPEGETP